jgi:AAA family ATP:ADP antiporter
MAPPAMKEGNGFALVFKSRYLVLIAMLLVLLNVVNTVGEFILGQALLTRAAARAALEPAFHEQAFIGAFYGSYFFWVNVAAIILQAFVVSRLVKRFGMAGVVFALPVVALGVYGLASAGAGIAALRWFKTAENAADYSVMNTAKQMLWLPTSPEEKYKAKQAIDTFFVRSGDMLAAGVVFLGTHVFHEGVAGFARVNVLIVFGAIGVAVLLLREYRRLTPSESSPAERPPAPLARPVPAAS